MLARLSFVFGEDINLSEEENMDESVQVSYVPAALPFTGKLRIERDYTLGEYCQFSMEYPSVLQEKISQSQFQESMSKINLLLYRAESNRARHSLDHLLACLTLYTFPLCFESFYQKRMDELDQAIQAENDRVYAPVGLKLWNPKNYAFLYVSFCQIYDLHIHLEESLNDIYICAA
ncbi:hypothetical protein K493DRAFT_347625 [Basidiobolus meristosporus CBS 931.73]|uniref:Ras modification protein ERF4 n=1 Tax=Basidiobolus meristosporus CBS 931.73 TaxID=1314790 RepID=A0A1Y1YS32_9FUNG|nr:hypothetical protein K493DRAFT_347625 [Basidiobolus meristosporus CBS 931.73]|eukprot:ORY00832.1 hypothetical protein K493DRAFT_347625 [Basidiobolus meristosporus CBS 931.73]